MRVFVPIVQLVWRLIQFQLWVPGSLLFRGDSKAGEFVTLLDSVLADIGNDLGRVS